MLLPFTLKACPPYRSGGRIPMSHLVGVIAALALLLIAADFVLINHLNPRSDLEQFVLDDSCPLCLGGDHSCRHFTTESFSRHRIFTGSYHGTRAVAKSLLSPDVDLSPAHEYTGQLCQYISTHLPNLDCRDKRTRIAVLANITDTASLSRVFPEQNLCPSDRLYKFDSAQDVYRLLVDPSLYYSLKKNILGAEGLFPRVLAVCPEAVVYANAGKSLRELEHAPLVSRMRLAYGSLILAHRLSLTPTGFVIYMTDTSLDNLVLTSSGSVMPVDLDHLHIVDVRSVPDGGSYYTQTVDQCDNDCIKFFPRELCKHEGGDMNYYLVCRYILSPLLHDASDDILASIDSCIHHSADLNRSNVSHALMDTLYAKLLAS